MLSSNTLQAPATGRSRFSKALPSVPGLHADLSKESPLPPVPIKSAVPPRKELPPPPPAPKDSPAQSIAPTYKPFTPPTSSVTSPVSSTTTPTSAKPLPPMMGIPRKAVGSGPPKTPALETAKPVLVSPPLMGGAFKVDVPAASSTAAMSSNLPALPMKSPSESLSSILSAYSRSSSESPVKSSEGHTSSQYSDPTLSPSQIAPASSESSTASKPTAAAPPPPSKDTGSAMPRDFASPPTVPPKQTSQPIQASLPPPPPTKDEVSQPQINQQPDSDIAAPSPPRPQIWRRRSANQSKDLPDLKLISSHGSTAASTPQVPPKGGSETSSIKTHSTAETVKPSPPPKSKPLPPIGLPGRNIRPAGNKFEAKSEETIKDRMSEGVQDASHDGGRAENVRPVAARPPTPEYQNQDVRTPVLDYFIPPESPASSPDPAQGGDGEATGFPSGATNAETTRSKPVLKLDTKGSVTRKAVGSAQAPTPAQDLPKPPPPRADLQPARSVPDLRAQAPSPSNMPMPSFPSAGSSIGSPRGRSPSAFSARGRDASQTRGPPRGSSVRPDGSRTPLHQRDPRHSAPERDDPRLVRSNSRGMCYRGRDGTLYPEMKELPEPDEKAAHFPSHPEGPIAGGTILAAPPIRNTHYLCYQKHRTMGRRSNRQNPLACQTCEKSDAEDRWACSFCQLRICHSCFDSFNAKHRDLQALVNSLRVPDVGEGLSLPSERAGSGLGLNIDFS